MSKVKERSLVDFSKRGLQEIFTKAGLNSQDIDRAIADYLRYRDSELSSLSVLSYKELQKLGAEAFTEEILKLRQGGELVDEIVKEYLQYVNYKKDIAETYQENKSWDEVISTVVYLDVKESQESFIDYVEEIYGTKIKDSKHLQKLTGITEETLEGLEDTLICSRYSKYFRALEKALKEGAKYKDLLDIKPQDFGLPKTWSGCRGSDQYSSILWALSYEFLISEPGSLMLLPDLRSIALDLDAPYSVLMECYKLTSLRK